MAAAIAVFVALLSATPAGARSVSDPDIGWPTSLRRELRLAKIPTAPCHTELTGRMIHLQDRIGRRDPRDALYRILHDRAGTNIWGNLWYDPCDGGRLHVGVAAGGTASATRIALARARRAVARRGQGRDVRFVAVRSTYRQLSDATEAFDAALGDRLSEVVSVGTQTARNALVIDVDARASAEDRRAVRAWATASPVSVVVHAEPPPDPDAPVPTYDAQLTVDRATVDRGLPTVGVVVADQSCMADETYDTAQRFAGVRVTRVRGAWVLRARLRVNPDWPQASTCVGHEDERLLVRTTVTLPAPLGDRGIVDGAGEPDETRTVRLPPVGAAAIRSLVPRFVYAGEDCDDPAVRRAFHGRRKTEWCFF